MIRKKRLWAGVLAVGGELLVLLSLFSCRAPSPAGFQEVREPERADAERLREDILFLTGPACGGRGPASAGLERAAEYIGQRMAEAGLLPAGDTGFFWHFLAPAPHQEDDSARLTLPLHSPVGFTRTTAIVLYGGSPAGEVRGELLYGEFRQDGSREETLAEGRVVVLQESDGRSLDVRELAARIKRAAAAGAHAILTVPHPFYPTPLDPPVVGELPVPVFRVHPKLSLFWLGLAQMNPAALQEAGGVALLPFLVEIVSRGRSQVRARNVVGFLPGKEEGEKAVVLSAHYDHIGMGRLGWGESLGVLHPGADDNASGTAALLEAARLLALLPPCKRPIWFVAYAFEEEGLLGSDAFAEEHKENIFAVLNLDMVGRLGGGPVRVNGDPGGVLGEALKEALGEGWFLGQGPSQEEGPQSDHSSFLLRGVPAVSLTSGLHSDHHKPTDTPDKIDYEGAASIAYAAARMARRLACQ